MSLVLERAELTVKIGRLADFMATSAFRELPQVDRDMLIVQHGHMVNYAYVLTQRINARTTDWAIKP